MLTESSTDYFGFGYFGFGVGLIGSVNRFSGYMPTPRCNSDAKIVITCTWITNSLRKSASGCKLSMALKHNYQMQNLTGMVNVRG